MRRLLQSSWASYAIALLAVALALALRSALDPLLGNTARTVTLHAAVAVAAWTGGFLPGVFAAVIGYLGADYFFIEPRGSVSFSQRDAGLFIGYAISALVISLLGAAMRAARRRARAAAAQIESSEERFRTFMDHSPVCVFLKDEEGRYVFMNRAGEELLGVTRERWEGKTDIDLLPVQVAATVQARDRQVLEADDAAVYPLRMPTAAGERQLHSTKFPLRDSSGRRYVGSVTVDLTELRRSEEELRREREQLRIVADTMSVAVARVARDMTFVWVNRVFAEWLGESAERVVGRPIADVLGADAAAQIRPYLDLVQRGERVRYERLANYAGLGRRWIHAMYSPIFDSEGKPDGWVAVVSDIEERKQAEQALRAAQEQLQVVVNAIPAAVLRCSRELRYLWVNSVYAHWLGRPAHELVGRRIDELLGADAVRELQPYIDRVLGGEQVHFERLVELPGSRSKRWVSTVYAPVLEPGGEASGWVAISFDIHERKQMEEALRDADRRKDEFLATLAHELRNPLAPIRNAMAILERKGPAEAELQWSREVINRQVDQMSRLVDDLLDIARISRGGLLVRKERVALERVVDMALETSRPQINAARHRLSVLMPNERVMLEADPTRLAQAFANLLINAAKFTEPGGAISVSATVEGGEVTVSVEDSGIGFGAEVASSLFQPFSQLPATRERSHGGLGIGLSLTQGIIELHGGSVQARSGGPGQGAEFVVRLPILVATEEPREVAREKATASVPPIGFKVLVADDNRDAADSLSRVLALYGYEVRVAYDGKSAVELGASFAPKVAVLDIGMPGANGYDVAHAMRKQHGNGVTLVALTGYGREDDRKRAVDAGFDYHLTKPVDPAALNDLLVQVAAR